MPEVSIVNVDMGKALLNKQKDSVVTAFYTNTGPVPIRIDTMYFTGADAGLFSIVSGAPPYTIPTGETHPVEFRFLTSTLGVKSAGITIFTQAETLMTTITGEGVYPAVEVTTTMVDFGPLTVNKTRDSVLSTVIRNIGSAPLNVSGTRLLGPDTTQFIIVSGGGAFTLQPGENHPMRLQFAPIRVGRTSGRIGFDHDADGSPSTMELYGEGLHIVGSAVIWIDTLRARIGDTVEVAIRMRDTVSVVECGTTRISTELHLNSSMLLPLDGTPQGVKNNGQRMILLDSLPVVTDAGGALARLRFLAVLGDAEWTDLRLENTQFIGGVIVDTVISGYFALTDICHEGGPRLIDMGGKISLKQNRPNPFNAATVIDYEVIESGPVSMIVMDQLGRKVAVLVDGEVSRGKHTIGFDASALPSGVYMLVMQTPTVRMVRRMEVIK
jgi:hypothetical protein